MCQERDVKGSDLSYISVEVIFILVVVRDQLISSVIHTQTHQLKKRHSVNVNQSGLCIRTNYITVYTKSNTQKLLPAHSTLGQNIFITMKIILQFKQGVHPLNA